MACDTSNCRKFSLNSLTNANENELTFFNDTSQLKKLEETKAKACLINKKYSK